MGRAYNLQLMSNNSNQEFKNMVASLTGGANTTEMRKQRHKWIWYMNFLKWWTHSFLIENCDELNKIKPFLIEKMFWNGCVGIIKVGKGYIPVGLKDIKKSADGYIHSAVVDKNSNLFEKINVSKVDRENCVFIQPNVYAWPMFIEIDTLIEPILDVWELMPAEITNAITKIIFKIATDNNKDRQSILKEIDAMYNRKGKLIQVISGKLGDEIQLKSETISDKLQEYFKFIRNYAFNMTGRLFNASEKRERNITSEVSINTLQFDVVLNDYLFYIEKALVDFNKIFGENASLKTLRDAQQEKEMELQASMMLHQGNQKETDKNNPGTNESKQGK